MASQGLTSSQTSVVGSGGKSPVVTPVMWAINFLHGIGAPTSTSNINLILAWGNAESGAPGSHRQTYGGWDGFNPLNVVRQSGDNSLPGGNSVDVVNFGTLADGVAASVRLFTGNRNAKPIIDMLKRGNATPQDLTNVLDPFYTWDPTFALSGSAPTGGNTNLGSGSVAGNVRTQSLWSSLNEQINRGLLPWPIYNIVGGGLFGGGSNPISDTGSAIQAIGKTAQGVGLVTTWIAGIFSNWRMVVQFFGGVTLALVGVFLILHDTGVGGKAASAGAKVAAIAA